MTEILILAFIKNRLLDYEIKLKNKSNDTSSKILQAGMQEKPNVRMRVTDRNYKNYRRSQK